VKREERSATQEVELLPDAHPVHCTGFWASGVKNTTQEWYTGAF